MAGSATIEKLDLKAGHTRRSVEMAAAILLASEAVETYCASNVPNCIDVHFRICQAHRILIAQYIEEKLPGVCIHGDEVFDWTCVLDIARTIHRANRRAAKRGASCSA